MKSARFMNIKKLLKDAKGFTLIELLVVIGILAVLLAIVLIAINPAHQFAQARDTQRRSDVEAILNAVDQYMAENQGNLPTGITTTPQDITSTAGAGNIDLCADLVTKYIADIPVDPQTGSHTPTGSHCNDSGATYDTKYSISKSASDNRLTVSAVGELTPVISVTR